MTRTNQISDLEMLLTENKTRPFSCSGVVQHYGTRATSPLQRAFINRTVRFFINVFEHSHERFIRYLACNNSSHVPDESDELLWIELPCTEQRTFIHTREMAVADEASCSVQRGISGTASSCHRESRRCACRSCVPGPLSDRPTTH